eukprot:SAG22_NODE_17361_length_306_cov_0.753623_1_plen_62_part_10
MSESAESVFRSHWLQRDCESKLTDTVRLVLVCCCSGGYTWADIWYLEQRQPEIMTGTCNQAL